MNAKKMRREGTGVLGSRRPLLLGIVAMMFVCAAPAAAIDVAIVASPDPARAGEMLDVKITVTNDGAFAASNLSVQMVYPVGLNSLGNGNFDGSCPGTSCSGGQIATFTIPTLAPGAGLTYHLAPRVSGSVESNTVIPFDVEVLIGGKVQASASTDVIVDNTRTVNLALVEHRNPVSPGDLLTYSMTYGVSTTGGGALNAMLSLPIPPGTSFVSATEGGTVQGNEVVWGLGNLNPGTVGRRSVTLQISAGVNPGAIILADAAYSDDSGNNVAFAAATGVVNQHPLEIAITASPDPVRQNQAQDVQITVTNTGAFDRTGVVLRVEYPDLLSSLGNENFDGSCSGTSCSAQQLAVFDIGTLPAGKGRTFVMPIRVASSTADSSVLVVQGNVRDSTGDRRRSGAPMAVRSLRTLELGVTEDRNPVRPGDRVTYTLSYGQLVTGAGIVGAMLSFPVPDGMSLVEASDGGTLNGGIVEWSLGNLNPGAVGQRTVTLEVDSNLGPGTILWSEAVFRDAGANIVHYPITTFIQEETPLDFIVVASPDPARQGQTQHVHLHVTNTSPFDRTGVQIRLEYPDHVGTLGNSLFDGACSGTSCSTTQPAVFDVGTLSAGKSTAFNMPIQVFSGTDDGTVVRFKAHVRDSTGERRRSGSTIAVRGARNLEISMTADRDPVAPGQLLNYDLSYGVTSSGVTGTSLRLPIPAGTSFVSASDGGMVVGNAVEWSIGSLNPGQSGTRRVTVEVDSDAPIGSIITAEASFRDAGANAVRFRSASRVQADTPLQFSVVASPAPARPGQTIFLEMTATNTGIFDLTNVVVRMEYPSGLTTLGNSNVSGGACQGTSCVPQNTAVFNIGTLPPGRGRTVTMQLQPASATPDGSAIAMFADVTDSTGDRRRGGANVTIDSARKLDLSLRESNEPIQPGQTMTYTLTYGTLEGAGGSTGTMLHFAPPAGTTVTNISTGGTLVGDVVEWAIGSLNPGGGGERTVQVQVDPDLPFGSILPATAWIDDAGATTNRVRYGETTRIEESSPLDFELIVAPCAGQPGSTVNVMLSITNTTPFDRTGVEILVEYPDGLNNLGNSSIPGGACQGTSCVPQNQAFFNVGTVEAGQTVNFSMPPVISNNTPRGTVIKFNGIGRDSTGFMSRDSGAIFVGLDYEPAVGSDLNGDGVVNVFDLLILLSEWGTCAEPDKCPADLNCDGVVNVFDLLVLLSNWS